LTNRIDGRKIAQAFREQLKHQTADLRKRGIVPTLVIFYIGDDPSAEPYFNAKRKLAESLGVQVYARRYPKIDQADLVRQIESCNGNGEIDGVFVELPLPKWVDDQRVRRAVAPHKDVDGINPSNLGRLVTGEATLLPATPMGVLELLRASRVRFEGQDVVMVGIPLGLLLMREHAPVTICHSRTKDLAEKTRAADILCVAVGRPRFITADMVKQGATVVDIGVNVTPDGIRGDVAFDEVAPKAGLITPVPGGIGPMTSTMVMSNLVQSARRRL